jgi:imidazolonepropionase-like amidohydrolase/Tol biopolymer transport system component
MLKHLLYCLGIFLGIVFPLSAQTNQTEKKPSFAEHWKTLTKEIAHIDVNEGTWMSVDVSQDQKTIIFDLLGDLYLLPWEGGIAQNISSGSSWDMQPTFSPDGKWIAFTSDADGADNIWVMSSTDFNQKWQVSKEKDRLLNSPAWTEDSKGIVARKHFSNYRSLGAGELWLYHFKGNASGVQMTQKASDQKDEGEPAISMDGQWVYYSQDISDTKNFEYNKNANQGIYGIKRFNRETGESKIILSGAGGAIRPTPSWDGKKLAFIRRVDGKSWVWLHDLQTNAQTPLFGPVERDLQETWAIHGVYPRMAFTRDDQWLVFWAQGKIKRFHLGSKKIEEVPFSIKDQRELTKSLKFKVNLNQTEVKQINHPQLFAKGVFFQTLGHLYFQSLNPDPQSTSPQSTNPQSTSPQKLPLSTEDFYFYPQLSIDEKQLLYVRWNDQNLGSIEMIDVEQYLLTPEKPLAPKILSLTPGHYADPVLSADGTYLIYQRIESGYITSPLYSQKTGLFALNLQTHQEILIHAQGKEAHVSEKAKNVIYYTDLSDPENRCLKAFHLDELKSHTLSCSENAYQFKISPQLDHIVFASEYQAYLSAFQHSILPSKIGEGKNAFPIQKLNQKAAYDLNWWKDWVYWHLGNELYLYQTKNIFESEEQNRLNSVTIHLPLIQQRFTERIIIEHANIITAQDQQPLISNGSVIIENQRIFAVDQHDKILELLKTLPPATQEIKIDAKGKTLMPGLIDVHAHGPYSNESIIPQHNWHLYASLAFGVTTQHDPSSDSQTVFSTSELLKAGRIKGPRLFSTGTILYGARGDYHATIQDVDSAKFHVEKLKKMGAFSVKSYNQPRRDQRQQVLSAARELEMMVVPEGGSLFHHNMTMIIDGHTGIEHAIPLANLYADVLQLWQQSKVGYTPTFNVAYGGLMGENYWYQESRVYEHPLLQKYVPQALLTNRARRVITAPSHEWNHIDVAKHSKKLFDLGVNLNLGAHGQREGLGAHWELWSMVQGGFTPMEAILAGTRNGARYLGLDDDLGQIAKGKLADLILIDGNPLANIRDSQKISLVIHDGKIYDPHKAPDFFFKDQQIQVSEDQLKHCGCEP